MRFKQSIPNILTISRAIATIIIAVLFFTPFESKFIWIFVLFLYASFTDFSDGYLARKWKVVSVFGVVFDSLFDKILILSLFLLLIPYHVVHDAFLVLLFFRELFVDGIKNYLLSRNCPIPAIITGKIKFMFQVLMIAFILLSLIFPEIDYSRKVAAISTILACIFAYISAYSYVRIFIKFIKTK